jgi:hypothetical protein
MNHEGTKTRRKKPRELLVWGFVLFSCLRGFVVSSFAQQQFDVVIVGGTPGGIISAIATARMGGTALLLERTQHIGGLPANGLGATDLQTRGATGGLFLEFVKRIKAHYVEAYGTDSPQARDCSDGYHFEPSVAEKVFEKMLAEQPKITVRKMREFDAKKENVTLDGTKLARIRVLNRENNQMEAYAAKCFIDATYEGDLAAAAGAPFRTRREGKNEYNEPLAGRVYKQWRTDPHELGEGSTGEGDDTIQAYNYRLCLTRDPKNRVMVEKPAKYDRAEYGAMADDVKNDRWTNKGGKAGGEIETYGIGRIVNMVRLPNGKNDANNQHAAFISTDLPEENYQWPTADWTWRDTFAVRMRDYTLGLIYFAQNDESLPEDFRERARAWGLAKDEYTDNGNFPRQVYVREGRRIEGEHLFTAHDALPKEPNGRPPVYRNSITASHYALDSHAHRKREEDRVHLDGFLSHPTRPYTVPLGVIVPKQVDNLLTPVPVSGTHIGFSTLRMEPCWMAMGQAAGTAAMLAIRESVAPRAVHIDALQDELLKNNAVLIYFTDMKANDKHFAVIQKAGVRGLIAGWAANAQKPVDETTAKAWMAAAGKTVTYEAGKTARGELAESLFGQ